MRRQRGQIEYPTDQNQPRNDFKVLAGNGGLKTDHKRQPNRKRDQHRVGNKKRRLLVFR